MKKGISIQEFEKSNPELTEYEVSNVEKAKRLFAEVEKYYPAQLYVVEMGNGSLHFEIFLEHPTLKLLISVYKDKYEIFNQSVRELKNVSQNNIREVEEKYEAPKKIGVLTTNKIGAWVKYHEAIYNDLKVYQDKNSNIIRDFYNSIEGLPVHWYGEDRRRGDIVMNGLKYSFTVEANYVSQTIEVYYATPNNLSTFLKLADNQFKK